jgi:hypothetical protein
MDYSGTIRRGWEIIWKNKWLWLLAFLPILLSFANLLVTSGNNLTVDPTMMTPDEAAAFAGRTLLLSCLSLLVTLVVLVFTLVTRAGMITGVARLARGEATGFGRSFNEGWRRLLPLLGLTILLYAIPIILFVIAMMLVLVPVSIGALAGGSGQDELLAGMGLLGTVLICCLSVAFLVAMLLLGFIYPFATRGIMLRRMGVIESLRHGWRVVRENLGEIILLALPFVLVYVLFGALFAAIYVIVAVPSIENAVLSGTVGFANWRFLLVFVFYGLIGALLNTWQSATLTLGYLQWTGKDVLGNTTPPAAPPGQ